MQNNNQDTQKKVGLLGGLGNYFNNPDNTMPILNAASAMMAASGYSDRPVNLAQIMSKGFQGYQQGRNQFLQEARQKKMDKLSEMRVHADIDNNRLRNMIAISKLNNPDSDLPSSIIEFEKYKKMSPSDQKRFMNLKRNTLNNGVYLDGSGNVRMLDGILDSKREVKAAESAGTALGKSEAEKVKSLGSQKSKIPQLMDTVKRLSELGQEANYTYGSRAKDAALRELGLPVSKGAVARAEYISLVDNQILPLLRDTFGSQFTEREGQSLKATLGDPNLSPQEKDAVLRSFIDQKKANIQSLEREVYGQSVAMPQNIVNQSMDLKGKYSLE